ncbi:MAG TPA: glycosyltransferase family 2 protein [Planctomycetes bacterium]|nr:glycosyltransferase family 2 protein [Planctomycetota bacterium]
MPCFNEEAVVGFTLRDLTDAFSAEGIPVEIIAVDNGSTDGTAGILEGLRSKGLPIEIVTVPVNEGYGAGILSGLPRCRAPWIGIIPADGQVDAEDVVRLFKILEAGPHPMLGKVRRRFRMDGFRRKVISIAYNALIGLIFPRLGSIDVNGLPKIIPAEAVRLMELSSRRWFLDPEIMIKAKVMKLPVLEMNVFARMRSAGMSHVRASTCWEFLTGLARYRLGGPLREWKRNYLASAANNSPSPDAAVEEAR